MLLENADLAGLSVLGPGHFLVPELGPVYLRGLFLVLGDQVGSPDQRGVDRVERKHGKERFAFVFLDECAGLARQSVGQVLAVRAIRKPRIPVREKYFLPPYGPPLEKPPALSS